MSDFDDWRAFNFTESTVQLWVFKKSTTDSRFRAWHVRTDETIEQLFRDAVTSAIVNTTEHVAYTPISQNNESSCLTHALEQSEGLIALLNLIDAPEAENSAATLTHLKGAAGYLVKFQHDGNTVYAVRKAAPSWKPTVRKSWINAAFRNGELSITPEETFTFDVFFDFYCINETVFIKSKRSYETTMSEKKAYQENFKQLALDPAFSGIFSNIQPLIDHIGTNAMQLRRVAVIQSKALYLRKDFNQRIRHVNLVRGYGLNFDAADRLIVSPLTAKTIMQVLLDHRLLSEITDTIYDVPDAEVV